MIEIIPAVMPENIDDLREKLGLIKGASSYVQIDVMDGIFVDNISFPYKKRGNLQVEENELPFWEDFNYEFDLMIKNPEKVVSHFIELGAGRIVFHYESTDRHGLDSAIAEAKSFDVEVGISLNNDTDLKEIFPLIEKVDFVQIMGISKIGFQGEGFDRRSLDRIKELRAHYPNLIISVDGSVNDETGGELVDAGANRLVSGSYIFESGDARESINNLLAIGE